MAALIGLFGAVIGISEGLRAISEHVPASAIGPADGIAHALVIIGITFLVATPAIAMLRYLRAGIEEFGTEMNDSANSIIGYVEQRWAPRRAKSSS